MTILATPPAQLNPLLPGAILAAYQNYARRQAWELPARDLEVEVCQQLASSNSTLLVRAVAPAAITKWHALFVEEQTAGRGRRGKSWLADGAGSLTFSVAWYAAPALDQLAGLSLVVGLAVQQTLQAQGLRSQLKWPNDIWVQQQKLGGILLETTGASQAPTVVIGIGLNLSLPQALRQQINQPVTALDEWIMVPERNQLAGHLLATLIWHLQQFTETGFAPFHAAYTAVDALRGLAIEIHDEIADAPTTVAWAQGVDRQGQLLVSTQPYAQAAQLAVLNTGTVSLRLHTKDQKRGGPAA